MDSVETSKDNMKLQNFYMDAKDFFSQNQFLLSTAFFNKALEIAKKINDEISICKISIYLAKLAERTGNFHKALLNLNDAIYCALNLGNDNIRVIVRYYFLVIRKKWIKQKEAFRHLLVAKEKLKEGNFIDVLFNFEKIIDLLIEIKDIASLILIIEDFILILIKIGQKKSALNLLDSNYKFIPFIDSKIFQYYLILKNLDDRAIFFYNIGEKKECTDILMEAYNIALKSNDYKSLDYFKHKLNLLIDNAELYLGPKLKSFITDTKIIRKKMDRIGNLGFKIFGEFWKVTYNYFIDIERAIDNFLTNIDPFENITFNLEPNHFDYYSVKIELIIQYIFIKDTEEFHIELMNKHEIEILLERILDKISLFYNEYFRKKIKEIKEIIEEKEISRKIPNRTIKEFLKEYQKYEIAFKTKLRAEDALKSGKIEDAIFKIRQSIDLYKLDNCVEGEIRALWTYSEILEKSELTEDGNTKDARGKIIEALNKSKEIKNKYLFSKSLLKLGIYHKNLDEFQMSSKILAKAMKNALEIEIKDEVTQNEKEDLINSIKKAISNR